MKYIDSLNRRLGDALGWIRYPDRPRFAWLWAPDQPRWVYDTDDRTLLRKSWASASAPDGGEIGRAWVMGQWRRSQVQDHHGFGEGIRVPFVREFDYQPHFETTLARGQEPTMELTQNYVWALVKMLGESVEMRQGSFAEHLAEEKWQSEKNLERDRVANLERAREVYDGAVGAFGNCEPGKRDGWMSFMRPETGNMGEGFFGS